MSCWEQGMNFKRDSKPFLYIEHYLSFKQYERDISFTLATFNLSIKLNNKPKIKTLIWNINGQNTISG